MTKFQAMLGVIALSSSVLVGCTTNNEIMTKLDALQADVDALKSQQAKLASELSYVKNEAERANQRLDASSRRYKK
ncbi:MAG: hypothetical protein K6F05_01620 [Succinivibrio sp.]|nr:hypothetical protein [Succinivibrio sp.]